MARSKATPGRVGPRFVCDAMLGSLARKLRILGFDTAYHRDGSDAELISVARREARIILTADRELASGPHEGARVILVGGETDRERLLSLKERAQSERIRLLDLGSRCAVCNGALELCGKDKLRALLPGTVLSRHRIFYICVDCGKSYWKGGHWARIRRYSALLRSKRI